jgi:bacterioferritin-associated ferredoxin
MYVCICRAVTDGQIREAAEDGARHLRDLRQQLGVATGCGRCASQARDILARSQPAPDSCEGAGAELLPAPA